MLADGTSGRPRLITKIEQSEGEFDCLWQEMITPRFKFDRSYRIIRRIGILDKIG
jgi:hypothetical protein